jgi:hypothetical protein
MKTSWITLSFSSCSMSRTSPTSSWAVIFLMETEGVIFRVLSATIVALVAFDGPLLAVLVLVARIWGFCWFLLGQLRPMCHWRRHLKHLPSWRNLAISSSDIAALARVSPGVRSMAFGSLAKCCCHCCLVGFLFRLPQSKKDCHWRYL